MLVKIIVKSYWFTDEQQQFCWDNPAVVNWNIDYMPSNGDLLELSGIWETLPENHPVRIEMIESTIVDFIEYEVKPMGIDPIIYCKYQ